MSEKKAHWFITGVLCLVVGITAFGLGRFKIPPPAVEALSVPSRDPAPAQAVPVVRLQPFTILTEALEYLDQEYYDQPLDYDKLAQGALNGMLASLGDHNTRYIGPLRAQTLQDAPAAGHYGGIGASLDIVNGAWMVVNITPGTPADTASLRPGDMVLEINNRPIDDLDLLSVNQLLSGPAGSRVTLKVRRGTYPANQITLTREEISAASVSTKMLPSQIGYIALNIFTDQTTDELDQALQKLGEAHGKALILDLRGNPGGFLTTALEAAGRFISPYGGPVMYWQEAGTTAHPLPALPAQHGPADLPMVVMVDESSASAAEILAAALQYYGRARLVGTHTYGKGTVQNVHPLSDGGSLRITTAHWLTPGRVDISGTGIIPDYEVERNLSDEKAGFDAQLAWARLLLIETVLNPNQNYPGE
ncbi:MAG: S41 family peptidase [Chloroflexi bacterium]|nr:S41 family peptidase [Chloroflexota bacterium]